ncbi:Polynucleotidyl transferase- ribonuclease H-like superfamily protein, partial [Striga hermonthica]
TTSHATSQPRSRASQPPPEQTTRRTDVGRNPPILPHEETAESQSGHSRRSLPHARHRIPSNPAQTDLRQHIERNRARQESSELETLRRRIAELESRQRAPEDPPRQASTSAQVYLEADSPLTPELTSKPVPGKVKVPQIGLYDGTSDPESHLATYQRLVNKMFATMIGHTMEVYADDMLVKSVHASDHISHLQDMFDILRSYSMVLNPKKCTFGVESGKFLGYMVSQRGIEANLAKIKAIQDLTPPTSIKGVQALTGRRAALNRFISKSMDRCKPFFEAIKKGKHFEWTKECQKALISIKETLASPSTLQKPRPEEMRFLYLGVSDSAVSAVLIREKGTLQSPVYYISKALQDAELRYPPMEKLAFALVIAARKLRPYFQEHSIMVRTSYPLRQILHRPETSGRMIKWAIELGQFDIHYQPRTTIKAKVLSDFIAEFTPAITSHDDNQPWVLYIDGSSTANRASAGIVLANPENRLFCHSGKFLFHATNNEAEYEALLSGLNLVESMNVKHLKVFSDSQLLVNQINGSYEVKEPR